MFFYEFLSGKIGNEGHKIEKHRNDKNSILIKKYDIEPIFPSYEGTVGILVR